MRKISLRTLFLIAGVASVIAALLITSQLWRVIDQNRSVRQAWLEFERERSEVQRLEGQLYVALGYGGIFHNLSNYILRGDVNTYNQLIAGVGATQMVLTELEKTNPTDAEAQALAYIREWTDLVQDAATKMAGWKAEGRSIVEVIQPFQSAEVRMVRALVTLEKENAQRRAMFDAQETRLSLLTEIRARRGLSGFISNFKVGVLAGMETSLDKALERLQAIRVKLDRYQQLVTTRSEEIALEDLRLVLSQYEAMVPIVRDMHAQGIPPAQIDARVRVNDAPAFRALTLLDRAVSRALRARTEKMANSLDAIESIETQLLFSILSVFVLFAGGVLLAIHSLAVQPIARLSDVISRLSEGQLDQSVPYTAQGNEVGVIARAVTVFQDTMRRRIEAERELEITNEELNYQLSSLREMRDRSEEEAAKALQTTRELTEARDRAEIANHAAEMERKKLFSVVNTMTDALVTIDKLGAIETFNPAAERMFGFAADEIVGRNVSVLMPDEQAADHDAHLSDYLGGKAKRSPGEVRELIGRRKGGHEFPIELATSSMLIGEDVKFAGIIRDITDRKKSEEEIRRLALTDPLTGLANRNQFLTRLDEAIKYSMRRKTPFALVMLDLDKFKPVNDTHGHPVGDALLVRVARHLKEISRDVDTVARLGGDEFAMILVDLDGPDNVKIPVARIVEVLGLPMEVLGQTVQIGASAGVALYPNDCDDEDDLIKKADFALYEAKSAGRNTFRMYSELDVADNNIVQLSGTPKTGQ